MFAPDPIKVSLSLSLSLSSSTCTSTYGSTDYIWRKKRSCAISSLFNLAVMTTHMSIGSSFVAFTSWTGRREGRRRPGIAAGQTTHRSGPSIHQVEMGGASTSGRGYFCLSFYVYTEYASLHLDPVSLFALQYVSGPILFSRDCLLVLQHAVPERRYSYLCTTSLRTRTKILARLVVVFAITRTPRTVLHVLQELWLQSS